MVLGFQNALDDLTREKHQYSCSDRQDATVSIKGPYFSIWHRPKDFYSWETT